MKKSFLSFKMNSNDRVSRFLCYYAVKHLNHRNIIHISAFTERILIKVEHEINYLHDEGLLSPSEETINLLNRMCRRAYDLSVYFLRSERNFLTTLFLRWIISCPILSTRENFAFSPNLNFPCFNK